jgi:pSer/pThr/pTyr-binding forkhead associated (FHA) protein
MLELELRSEGQTLRVHRFDQDVVFIGRDPKNDVSFEDRSASRHHARILRSAAGYELEDLGSRNGTRLNDQATRHAALRSGDQIRIGGHSLVILRAEAGVMRAATDAAPPEELDRTRVAAYSEPSADESGPAWTLVVEREGKVLSTWPLETERCSIGRDPSCDVVLADDDVSRHHARIRRKHGKYYVEDLDSLNGTLVDGEPVYTARLGEATDLRIGPYRLRLLPPAEVPAGQASRAASCAACGRTVSTAWPSCPLCDSPPSRAPGLGLPLRPLKAPDPSIDELLPDARLKLSIETLASEQQFWVSFDELGEIRHPVGQVPDEIHGCPRCLYVADPSEGSAICPSCCAAMLREIDVRSILAEWSRLGPVRVSLVRVTPRPRQSALVDVTLSPVERLAD